MENNRSLEIKVFRKLSISTEIQNIMTAPVALINGEIIQYPSKYLLEKYLL
jgi:hypothetical protein